MIACENVLTRVKSNFSFPSTVNEKVDEALSTISKVGALAGAITYAANGLSNFAGTSAEVSAWTTPLFLVSIGLQGAGIILKIKSLVETHIFLKSFQKAASSMEKLENYTLEQFSSGASLINKKAEAEKHFVKKHFGVGNEKVVSWLNSIKKQAEKTFNSGDGTKIAECKAKMKNAVELLDKRMMTMKKSKAFTLTVAVISIIGTVILMTTPLAPLGLALIGVGIALEIGHFLKMRSLTQTFEKNMSVIDEKALGSLIN